jgi:hypothetical protein
LAAKDAEVGEEVCLLFGGGTLFAISRAKRRERGGERDEKGVVKEGKERGRQAKGWDKRSRRVGDHWVMLH